MFHNIKLYLFSIFVFMTSITSSFGVMITYDLNGGALPSGETSYSVESNNNNNVILANPVKTVDGTDYIFAGWCKSSDYDNGECSSQKCVVEDNGTYSVRWTIPCAGDTISENTTYIALWIEDMEVTCPAGRSGTFKGRHSSCDGCDSGSYSSTVATYKLSDTINFDYTGHSEYFSACIACSGSTYSGYYATSCTTCPDGLSANPDHTGCICPDGYLWESHNETCISTTSPSCPAGQAMSLSYTEGECYADEHGEKVCDEVLTDIYCYTCVEGYWCDGGVEQHACDEGKYSVPGAGSANDCKLCSTVDHATGASDSNEHGCECESGYRWTTEGFCEPMWQDAFEIAPYGTNGGMVMAGVWVRYPYGNSSYDSTIGWLVFETPVASEDDMVAALENGKVGMMLCRGHEVLDTNNNVIDYAYTGPCTKAVRLCGGYAELESVFDVESSITVSWMMEKLHKNNYDDLFTSTTYLTEQGPNTDAVVFDIQDCSCTTDYVSVLSAPMCLIEVKPTYALPVKGSNGSVYYINLTQKEPLSEPTQLSSGHTLRIIAKSGVYEATDVIATSE